MERRGRASSAPRVPIVPGEAEAVARLVRGYLAATAVVVALATVGTFLSPGATAMSGPARIVGVTAILALQIAGARADWRRHLLQGRGQLAIDGIVIGLAVVNCVQPVVSGPDAMTAWGIAVTVVFAGLVTSSAGMVGVAVVVLGTGVAAIVRFAGTVEPVVPATALVLTAVLGSLSCFAGRSFRSSLRAQHDLAQQLQEQTVRTRHAQEQVIRELRHLDRIKDDVVSTVSHELRTPLTVIRGLAATLVRTDATMPADAAAEVLTRIERNAVDLQRIVARLLDYDRLGELAGHGERTVTDLGDAVDLARSMAEVADHTLLVDVPDAPLVRGSTALVARVIAELVDNAATHAPPATPISVTVRVEGGRACLRVTDQGPGIDPAHLPTLTEAFGRGGRLETRTTRGLGLGLSFCDRVLRRLGSELVLDECPSGTTIGFDLSILAVSPAAADRGAVRHTPTAA